MLHDLRRDLTAVERHAKADWLILLDLELLKVGNIVVESASIGQGLISREPGRLARPGALVS